MQGSRTIKTLGALLVCMTVGAFTLMLLDRAPVHLPAYALAAQPAHNSDSYQAFIRRTGQVPLQPAKWRNVIVLSSAALPDAESRCHFVIDADGAVAATDRWQRQADGDHTARYNFNESSIGICLVGRFDDVQPSEAQLRTLLHLVQAAQYELNIPAGNVRLRSTVVDGDDSPGQAFPAAWFQSQLLRARG